MRVGIDAVTPGLSLEPTVAGMRHYVVSVVSAMSAFDRHSEYVVFESPLTPLHELEGFSKVRRVVCPRVPRQRAARVLYQNSVFPVLLRRQGVDVTLGTCNVVPIANPRPYVVVLQSLQYYIHRSAFGRLQGSYLRASVRYSLRRADAVIALSQAAKEEAVHFTGVDRKKVSVVYHGVPTAIEAYASMHNERILSGQPYVLVISSLHRYKNVDRVLRAFAEARLRYGMAHRLRVIGQSGELRIEELQELARNLGVGESVDFLGGVSHQNLPPHYAGAEVLVYASLHETFGLPPLEAMALGCPVVAGRASAIPEVVGSAAELVDPLDTSDIARGIANVVLNPDRRAELVRLGRARASEFNWERTAANTLDVLWQVFRGSRPATPAHE